MSLERIVLADDAIGAWIVDEHGRRPAAPGELPRFERLAEALRERGLADVTVADRIPYSSDATTAIVITPGMLRDVIAHDEAGGLLAPRIFIAGADRADLLKLLERHRLAGGVDYAHWRVWESAPRAALTGRLEIARAMGADYDEQPPFASEHYGPLATADHADLPSLLLAYLRAYLA
jgi:hypothetical protein